MSQTPQAPARPSRPARKMTVTRSEQLTPELIRVYFAGDDLRAMEPLEKTDSYIKLLFAPEGADYSDFAGPWDEDAIKAALPREAWPVTRTYTIRHLDVERGEMAVDFVVHGSTGLAGPWAVAAQPGDVLAFRGPGGGWAPSDEADVTVFIGDESAIPAIAASLDVLADDARAKVFLEVSGEHAHPVLREKPGIDVIWAHREDNPGASYGETLAQVVRKAGLPQGEAAKGWHAFVHGNAEMIKDLRRYLFVESAWERPNVSISGYWRTGHTEDGWQSSKRAFVAEMEAEQDA